ncbi:MAG: hypothetical protein IPH58_01730 [Sphingobacteriales bacterium]|nr:hypothetical protein [Sphingobacteriales bacterium]
MIFSLKSDLLKEPVWMGMTLRYNLDMFTQFYLRKAGLSVFFDHSKGNWKVEKG